MKTFRQIGEACGTLISVYWKSLEHLPLGTSQLLIKTVDPNRILSSIWLEFTGFYYRVTSAWILDPYPAGNCSQRLSQGPSGFPRTAGLWSLTNAVPRLIVGIDFPISTVMPSLEPCTAPPPKLLALHAHDAFALHEVGSLLFPLHAIYSVPFCPSHGDIDGFLPHDAIC
ncbi:hypothetical protein AMTR_s00046p00166110 [Amborella trichopoda]|uniref:Uncharacterized protein n=1 Tax=Amborella trichopoda TaxID=13333 RepID=U5DC85_AMBTC|nr:hypothetical protein AMTR_s00046p00166110 [Amborella trichopoda]